MAMLNNQMVYIYIMGKKHKPIHELIFVLIWKLNHRASSTYTRVEKYKHSQKKGTHKQQSKGQPPF